MNKHSHSIITASVVTLFSFVGLGVYAVIAMSWFYIGREHSQAEYRYMKLNKINREGLKFIDAFKKEAWNFDSLFNDMILPMLTGISVYLMLHWMFI